MVHRPAIAHRQLALARLAVKEGAVGARHAHHGDTAAAEEAVLEGAERGLEPVGRHDDLPALLLGLTHLVEPLGHALDEQDVVARLDGQRLGRPAVSRRSSLLGQQLADARAQAVVVRDDDLPGAPRPPKGAEARQHRGRQVRTPGGRLAAPDALGHRRAHDQGGCFMGQRCERLDRVVCDDEVSRYVEMVSGLDANADALLHASTLDRPDRVCRRVLRPRCAALRLPPDAEWAHAVTHRHPDAMVGSAFAFLALVPVGRLARAHPCRAAERTHERQYLLSQFGRRGVVLHGHSILRHRAVVVTKALEYLQALRDIAQQIFSWQTLRVALLDTLRHRLVRTEPETSNRPRQIVRISGTTIADAEPVTAIVGFPKLVASR